MRNQCNKGYGRRCTEIICVSNEFEMVLAQSLWSEFIGQNLCGLLTRGITAIKWILMLIALKFDYKERFVDLTRDNLVCRTYINVRGIHKRYFSALMSSYFY